jgi:DNA polymerase (family 10)
VDRHEVARVLEEVAAMLELKGENPFKVRAYDQAARAILSFQGDLAGGVRTRELLRLPGIGTGIFSAIETLVETGRLPLAEELRASFPPGLRACLRVPGLGAKKAKALFDELGIDSLEALERACEEGRIAAVRGFGPKSAEKIAKGIALVRGSAGLHRYAAARRRAEEVLSALAATGLAGRLEIAGSLRRRREVIRDLDLVASSGRPRELAAAFADLPGVAEVIAAGGTKVSVRLSGGLAADLRIVAEEEFAAALLYFTGSKEHNTALRGRARRLGFKLNEYGLFRETDGTRLPCGSEEQIYALLGLAFVEPELREDRGEIEAAHEGRLPRLLRGQDLQGLIHLHTTESDGKSSLEEMVGAARDAGFRWAAVTDHSKSAAYARGLTEERVLAQRQAIRSAAESFPGFRIFHGTEADILADGSIDFGDEFLEGFDLVIASVHSRFGLSPEDQTRRLLRAVENPRVAVLGHPTGRLLLEREGLQADMDRVIEAAARSGCALEINGSPHRLDLDWRLCQNAGREGALFSIGPDAHSVAELGYTDLALGIARKGWVTAESTLNAKSAEELERWLAARKRAGATSAGA